MAVGTRTSRQSSKMFLKAIIALVLVSCASGSEEINQNIINKNVERAIDITSQLVKITNTITLENAGKEAAHGFVFAVEPSILGNLSVIVAKDSVKDDLEVVKSSKTEGYFEVKLKAPLNAGRSAVVTVETVFVKLLVPYPHSIAMKERQLVQYFGNHYYYSPYLTKKQTAVVTLPTKGIESYSKLKPVTQTASGITYGPYNDVPALSLNPMTLHYENNAPFLTVTRLERLIEISHWGNIAVEEHIEILHTGAKLKGSFSRYDYQRDVSNFPHSIASYKTFLPAAAHSIYYRDSNGNISTSQVRERKYWIELELRPRFPLFGGWRSSYILGYSVPSYDYLFKKSGNQFVLQMRLLDHVFNEMHVEDLETTIVLPVGVTDVKVTTPYEVERLQDSVTYKYLDTIGRKVIRLKKKNLVEHDKHTQEFQVKYEWKPILLLHEPILISAALYLMFMFVIIYVRLDFSIHKEHSKKD